LQARRSEILDGADISVIKPSYIGFDRLELSAGPGCLTTAPRPCKKVGLFSWKQKNLLKYRFAEA
jgi:hypothetical protein